MTSPTHKWLIVFLLIFQIGSSSMDVMFSAPIEASHHFSELDLKNTATSDCLHCNFCHAHAGHLAVFIQPHPLPITDTGTLQARDSDHYLNALLHSLYRPPIFSA